MLNPTKRFSDRVENYRKYRPGYPTEIYEYLITKAGLQPRAEIADLGSGTGLLSQLFLVHGHRVFGVEPNAAMRMAAEEVFSEDNNFVSIDGRAEAIPLADSSVDFVTAGQSFHWFEPGATRREVRRILRTGGQCALIWNTRSVKGSQFQKDYEDLLIRFGTDFKRVDHARNLPEEKLAELFAPNEMKHFSFRNEQVFDLQGLQGRLLSSSYAPTPADPNHKPMLDELGEIFNRHQQNGSVLFAYRTDVYHGKVG